jgi:hypothetical protein
MNQRTLGSVDYLHLFVFNQFALAQPLQYRLSSRTIYLQDQGIEPATVVLLVGLVSLIVPLLACMFVASAGLIRERLGRHIHGAVIFVCLVAIVLPIVKSARVIPGTVVVLISPALAVVALFGYWRFSWVRFFVSAAAPSLILFPAHFFWCTAISSYIFPHAELPRDLRVVENPVPIVLVVFDEFSGVTLLDEDNEIDAVRFPNFASLAQSATWYRNATSVHPRTEVAVPAILTGNYPRGRRPATVAEYPENLFTLLESSGQYEFVVFEPYTRLCVQPTDSSLEHKPRKYSEQWLELAATLPIVYLKHLFPTDVPFELPFVPMAWDAVRVMPPDTSDAATGVFRFRWNAARSEQFGEFLRRVDVAAKPTLHFLHIAIPHFPWCFLPSGRKYTGDDGSQHPPPGTTDDAETWGKDVRRVRIAHQRYLMQTGYADKLVGKLLDRLQDLGIFDQCLLIVTADHGVSFRPGHSRRLPDDENLPDLVSVPLFIKLPNQRAGFTCDRNAESIDIMPTIVDVLDLDGPPHMDGSSLLDHSAPERGQKRFFSDNRLFTLDAALRPLRSNAAQSDAHASVSSDGVGLPQSEPHIDLVGRTVDERSVIGSTDLNVWLRDPVAVPTADAIPFVPCYFHGFIRPSPPVDQPVTLAIAVDGVIQAVTQTFTDEWNRSTWTAMIPDALFEDAAEHNVQIYVVGVRDGRPVLHSVFDEPLRLKGHE